jgi:hypothetical protein
MQSEQFCLNFKMFTYRTKSDPPLPPCLRKETKYTRCTEYRKKKEFARKGGYCLRVSCDGWTGNQIRRLKKKEVQYYHYEYFIYRIAMGRDIRKRSSSLYSEEMFFCFQRDAVLLG